MCHPQSHKNHYDESTWFGRVRTLLVLMYTYIHKYTHIYTNIHKYTHTLYIYIIIINYMYIYNYIYTHKHTRHHKSDRSTGVSTFFSRLPFSHPRDGGLGESSSYPGRGGGPGWHNWVLLAKMRDALPLWRIVPLEPSVFMWFFLMDRCGFFQDFSMFFFSM